MPAARSDIDEKHGWHIGESFEFEFKIDDGTVGSAPAGMGSWTVAWFVRETPDDPDLTLRKDLGDGVDFDGTDTFTVTVDPADTEHMAPGQYWHTLSRVDGEVRDLSEGYAVIRHSARRNDA